MTHSIILHSCNNEPNRRTPKNKFIFPDRLMADAALSASAKVLATALLLHHAETGQCNPSLAAIGKMVGRNRRAIIRDIAQLTKGGWLTVESSGDCEQSFVVHQKSLVLA
jgi:hypothetical protein